MNKRSPTAPSLIVLFLASAALTSCQCGEKLATDYDTLESSAVVEGAPKPGEGAEMDVENTAPKPVEGSVPQAFGYVYDPSAPAIAEAHCQACHKLPGSADHRKQDWSIIMGHMAWWMAMGDDDVRRIAERIPSISAERILEKRDALRQLGEIADAPLIDADDWMRVLDAYVDAAPETLPDPAASIHYEPWPNVVVEPIGIDTLQGAIISALRVDDTRRRLLIGEISFGEDGIHGEVHEWTAGSGFGRTARFDNAPTGIEPWGEDLLVANIGSLFPSNERTGSLWRLAAGDWSKHRMIDGLLRTPHALPMGDAEVLVSSFGHETGELWIAKRTEDGMLERSQKLVRWPGAMEAIEADIDNDGTSEYLVLFGQADDGIYLVDRDDEQSDWRATMIVQRSPAFGHSDLSVVDIDGDGDVDLLVANGDNLDIPGSPPRPYHGVRIYENDGAGDFSEAMFFPMHGAYGVVAGNFDDDDDLEIAAVAYFLAENTSDQSVVILDRDERGQWHPFGVSGVEGTQFCRIAAGNLDDTPTDEVFLGACYRRPPGPEVPRLVRLSFGR